MKIWFLESNDDLVPMLRSRHWYLYLEKVLICLDLKCFSPIFNKGSWESGTCHHLVSGLRDRIVWVSFSYNVVMSLTPAAQLWLLQYVPVNCFLSPQVVTEHGVVCQLSSYDERAFHVLQYTWPLGRLDPFMT